MKSQHAKSKKLSVLPNVNINIKPRKNKKKKNSKSRRSSSGKAMSSPYLMSLFDPFNFMGARIPDDITTPSFAVSLDQRIVIPGTTNSGGTQGIFSAIALVVGNVSTGRDYYQATTDTGGIINWTGGNLTGSGTLFNVASLLRPVSAAVALTYQGSTNNDQGRIIVAFFPGATVPVTSGGVITLPTNLSNILAAPYAATLPASKRYASVRYAPVDAIARSYATAGYTNIRTVQNGSAQASYHSYGVLIIAIDGLASSPLSNVEVRLKENLECLPLNSQTSFQATDPSWSNPMEIAEVSNIIASDRNFNVQQSWENELSGVATVSTGNSFAAQPHKNGAIPGQTSNLFLGDVGSKLGRIAGDGLQSIVTGLL